MLFGGAEYEVQGQIYKLGEVLTAFLEYDAADYLAETKKEAPDIVALGRLVQSILFLISWRTISICWSPVEPYCGIFLIWRRTLN